MTTLDTKAIEALEAEARRLADAAAKGPRSYKEGYISDWGKQFITACHTLVPALCDAIRDLLEDRRVLTENLHKVADEAAQLFVRATKAEDALEKLQDSQVDKILAMTDEQVRALSVAEGSHPDIDAATCKASIAEALVEYHKRCATAAESALAERDKQLAELEARLAESVVPPGMNDLTTIS